MVRWKRFQVRWRKIQGRAHCILDMCGEWVYKNLIPLPENATEFCDHFYIKFYEQKITLISRTDGPDIDIKTEEFIEFLKKCVPRDILNECQFFGKFFIRIHDHKKGIKFHFHRNSYPKFLGGSWCYLSRDQYDNVYKNIREKIDKFYDGRFEASSW